MCKEGKNIYYFSRIEANLSRESVAELLSVSVESLGAYERGETRMPCDLVVRMADAYNDPYYDQFPRTGTLEGGHHVLQTAEQ